MYMTSGRPTRGRPAGDVQLRAPGGQGSRRSAGGRKHGRRRRSHSQPVANLPGMRPYRPGPRGVRSGRTPSSEGVDALTFDSRGVLPAIAQPVRWDPMVHPALPRPPLPSRPLARKPKRPSSRRVQEPRSAGRAGDAGRQACGRLLHSLDADGRREADADSTPRTSGRGRPGRAIRRTAPAQLPPEPDPVAYRIRDESRTRTMGRRDRPSRHRDPRKSGPHDARFVARRTGRHRLSVRSRDAAGNYRARGASFLICPA